MKLKPHFIQKEVEYLGHLITPQGLKTTSRLVAAVREFHIPKNVKETCQFLGLSSFYRWFIPLFTKVTMPLHQLTKKGAHFEWTSDCQVAFESKLCEAPVLGYQSFHKEFFLETDASTDGIGAVLSQFQDDKV